MNLKRKVAQMLVKLARSLSPAASSPFVVNYQFPVVESIRSIERIQAQVRTGLRLISEDPRVEEYSRQTISERLAEALLKGGYIDFTNDMDASRCPTYRTMTGTILVVKPEKTNLYEQ